MAVIRVLKVVRNERNGDLSPTIRHSPIDRFRACRQLSGFPARTPTTTNMLGKKKAARFELPSF